MRDETGVDLQVLTGDDEARLTFLAVRRWFGWSSGRLLVMDIGGGSLEMAAGIDEFERSSADPLLDLLLFSFPPAGAWLRVRSAQTTLPAPVLNPSAHC